jgi:hypothetical protein
LGKFHWLGFSSIGWRRSEMPAGKLGRCAISLRGHFSRRNAAEQNQAR